MKDKTISLLIDAVMNNQLKQVIQLLKRGVNPNSYEDPILLYSPLHYAAAHSGAEMAILLLKAGANLEAKDRDGDTPLQKAWLFHNIHFIQAISNIHAEKTPDLNS